MRTLPNRIDGLAVSRVGSEQIVLDPRTGTAHQLTPDAAAVWSLCDGRSTVAWASARLDLDAARVSAAVADLADAGLVVGGHTRRRVLQGGALAGAALVSSVIIPKAAAAASMTGGGGGGNPQGLSFNLFTVASAYGDSQTGPFFFFQGNTTTPAMAPAAVGFTDPSDGPGTGSAHGFHGTDGLFPYFYAVTGGDFYTAGTVRVLNNTFAVHPGNSLDAVVGFKNPTAGATITLSGDIKSRNTSGSGSGGVVLNIQNGAGSPGTGTSTASTNGTFGNGTSFSATFTNVAAGAFLYVIIDRNGDYSYDTTQLDLTATVN